MDVILKVSRSASWTDSKGRVRSPVDEFSLLNQPARHALHSYDATRLVAWEVGFLAVADAPHFSKPQQVSGPNGDLNEGCALGSVLAEEVTQALLPFWSELLLDLLGNLDTWIIAKDHLAVARGSAINLCDEIERHLDSGARTLSSSTHYHCARTSGIRVARLAQQWWPSGLGFFGGIQFTPQAPAATEQRVAQAASVDEPSLQYVSCLFQTLRSYDNAGIGVISAPELQHHVVSQLNIRGFQSGTVITL